MSYRILYINTQQVHHRTFVNLDSLGNTSTIDFMEIHLSLSLTHVVIYIIILVLLNWHLSIIIFTIRKVYVLLRFVQSEVIKKKIKIINTLYMYIISHKCSKIKLKENAQHPVHKIYLRFKILCYLFRRKKLKLFTARILHNNEEHHPEINWHLERQCSCIRQIMKEDIFNIECRTVLTSQALLTTELSPQISMIHINTCIILKSTFFLSIFQRYTLAVQI